MDWLERNKKTLILLGAIMLVAFVIRVINLTILPVFVDEAIYIRWSQIMRVESGLRFLPLSDGKQPLFMWITIPFFKIFSDPLFAGRFVSVLSGTGTITGIFALSLRLLDSKKSALTAAFLYSISPFSVFFDRMALADSLLTFFGVWTVFFGLLMAQTKRLDFAMITGFFLGGALLTKSPALFFVLLLPTLLIFVHGNLKNPKALIKYILLYAPVYLIGYGLYNILRLGPNFHLISSRNQDYVYPFTHILTSPLNPLISHLGDLVNWFSLLGPGVIFLLLPLALFTLYKKNKKVLMMLLIFISLPLLAQSIYAKVFTARYVLFVIPFIMITVSSALLTQNPKFKRMSMALLIIFAVFSLIQNFFFLTNPQKALLPRGERSGYLEDWTSGYGIKEVSEILEQKHLESSGKIVVGTEGYFGTLPDGLQIYLNHRPEITIVGVGVNLTELPSQLSESKAFGNTTYLVINDSRLLVEPQEIGLKEIASYPKATKPDGKTEQLKLYEVQ